MKITILPIKSYDFDITNEISQQDNWNANARLWIQSDNTVFKQYIKWNRTTRKNINTLLEVSQNKTLYAFPEIVMPINIYRTKKGICGYTMPYCEGISMEEFLVSPLVDIKAQLFSLISLANVIRKLPERVYIGDLHGANVLVEKNGKIHIIDIDGFSIQGCEISCPFSQKVKEKGIEKLKKYQHWNGKFKISRNSDIFCFYMLVLKWISKVDVFQFEKIEIYLYLQYLEQMEFPIGIINSIYNLYSNKRNSIEIDDFYQIDLEKLEQYRYVAFVNSKENQITVKIREEMKYLSLKDRVNELDKHETFEERAQIVSERECKNIIKRIEIIIKSKQYEIVKGTKQVIISLYKDICYSVGNNNYYADSPHYYGGSDSGYWVNNEFEAKYLINAIVERLEKEGCICKVNSRSSTHSNGIGFWDSIFKGSTTTYRFCISCIFQWRN